MNRLELLRDYLDTILAKIADDKTRRTGYMHLYGVAQFAVLLAYKRVLNAELAAIAAMLHDIYTYKSGDMINHEHLGSELANEILNELGITTRNETEIICTAIYNHGDKANIHSEYDELLKDADVLQHCFYNPTFEIKPHEKQRYEKLLVELGIDM